MEDFIHTECRTKCEYPPWILDDNWLKPILTKYACFTSNRGRCGRGCLVVECTTTYVIRAYHHWSYEFESRSWRGVLDTTLGDKVCQWIATGRWFSPVSSTNKTGFHDITEISFKVALSTITITLTAIPLSSTIFCTRTPKSANQKTVFVCCIVLIGSFLSAGTKNPQN